MNLTFGPQSTHKLLQLYYSITHIPLIKISHSSKHAQYQFYCTSRILLINFFFIQESFNCECYHSYHYVQLANFNDINQTNIQLL